MTSRSNSNALRVVLAALLNSPLSDVDLRKVADALSSDRLFSQQLATAIRTSLKAVSPSRKESDPLPAALSERTSEVDKLMTTSEFDAAGKRLVKLLLGKGWSKRMCLMMLQLRAPIAWVPEPKASLAENAQTLVRQLSRDQIQKLFELLRGSEERVDPFLAGIMKGAKNK